MNEEKRQHKIDAFLTGKLEGEEYQAFKLEIEANAELQKEVEWTALELTGIRNWQEKNRKKKLKEWGYPRRTKGFFPLKSWLFWFALAGLMILLGYLVLTKLLEESPPPPAVAEEYISDFENSWIDQIRGLEDSTEVAQLKTSFIQEYNRDFFEQALSTLDEINPKSMENGQWLIMKGLTLLRSRRYEEAEQLWLSLADHSDRRIRQAGEWGLYLTYTLQLPERETEWTELGLKIYSDDSNPYESYAKQIQDTIQD